MVIEGVGHSGLTITSDTHTAAHVTQTLGIDPTEAHETGWKRKRGPVRNYSWWSLDVGPSGGEEEHALSSIASLARLLEGKAAALASLADRYEMRIHWAGSSDATQGGFVIPAELLEQLGPLGAAGVNLHGTVYLDTPKHLWSRLRFAFSRY